MMGFNGVPNDFVECKDLRSLSTRDAHRVENAHALADTLHFRLQRIEVAAQAVWDIATLHMGESLQCIFGRAG